MRALMDDVKLHHEPYPYLTASSFYDAEALADVLWWCETALPWELVVQPYYQIYRCLLLLNRGWNRGMGGQTLILSGKTEREVHRVLDPINNRALIFEASHRSFHAIRPIMAGVRYTVAYEFRAQ
jgi:2-oxoglutarate-Fe(II)-dependent oxygenase superfamily protein